jgi:hypothetical protein
MHFAEIEKTIASVVFLETYDIIKSTEEEGRTLLLCGFFRIS